MITCKKRFSGFNRFSGFKGGGAAHKKEVPQSINNGDAMSWHSSHQSLETPNAAHKNVEAPRSINNSDARRSLDSRFPVLNFPNIVRLTANDKDFSLALEMTIRESDVSKSLSHKSLEISNP